MTPTTLHAVRDAVRALVPTIVPDYPRHRDKRWAELRHGEGDSLTATPELVCDTPLRTFMLDFGYADSEGQVYSDAAEWRVQLRVVTSYRALPDLEPPLIAAADGRQLWVLLSNQCDPVVPGLMATTTYEGFLPVNEETGHVWGAHQFTLRFLVGDD